VSANEAAAIGDTRTLISAEVGYHSASSGFYGSITCLNTPSTCIPGYPVGAPTFLDDSIAVSNTMKQGYISVWWETVDGAGPPGALDSYCYGSNPAVLNKTGVRAFGGDLAGAVVQSSNGATICCSASGTVAACVGLR
jgi:hypothetical protein